MQDFSAFNCMCKYKWCCHCHVCRSGCVLSWLQGCWCGCGWSKHAKGWMCSCLTMGRECRPSYVTKHLRHSKLQYDQQGGLRSQGRQQPAALHQTCPPSPLSPPCCVWLDQGWAPGLAQQEGVGARHRSSCTGKLRHAIVDPPRQC